MKEKEIDNSMSILRRRPAEEKHPSVRSGTTWSLGYVLIDTYVHSTLLLLIVETMNEHVTRAISLAMQAAIDRQ